MVKLPHDVQFMYIVSVDCTEEHLKRVVGELKLTGIEALMFVKPSGESEDTKKYKSDVLCVSEMMETAKKFYPSASYETSFNPVHFGAQLDLTSELVYDNDGDIESISGFTSPNTLCITTIKAYPGGPVIGKCSATAKFKLEQTMEEVLNDKIAVH